MTRLIAALAALAALTACGDDDVFTGEPKSELRVIEEADGAMWRLMHATRTEFCRQDVVRPLVQGTIQLVPRLGIYGRAPVGDAVQSSYFRSNSVNEEFRRGIVEFYAPGGVTSALLRFDEDRGWTSVPLPADSHLIMAYRGNGELDIDDFETAAVTVARFETDPNVEPRRDVAYDLTKALREAGPMMGLRFQLEHLVGSGTSFANLRLELTRCRALTVPAD